MKNLKKSFLAGASFFVAFGAAFAMNASNFLTEAPLFRERPSDNQMVDISNQCTLNAASGVLCSAIGLSSVNGKYWENTQKTVPNGGHDRLDVFAQIP